MLDISHWEHVWVNVCVYSMYVYILVYNKFVIFCMNTFVSPLLLTCVMLPPSLPPKTPTFGTSHSILPDLASTPLSGSLAPTPREVTVLSFMISSFLTNYGFKITLHCGLCYIYFYSCFLTLRCSLDSSISKSVCYNLMQANFAIPNSGYFW